MQTMFEGMINSPETTITNNISNGDTLIYVLDPTRVPSDLPNLMTLGTSSNAETVKVLSISGNALTVERGFQGTPAAWNAGTIIARNFTEYDYGALLQNILTLFSDKVNIAAIVDNITSTDTDKPLSAKQGKVLGDLLSSLQAETTHYIAYALKNISTGGVQTISGLPFTAKTITLRVIVDGTSIESEGISVGTGSQICKYKKSDGTLGLDTTNSILLFSVGAWLVSAKVTAITTSEIQITWYIASGTPSGTAIVFVEIDKH